MTPTEYRALRRRLGTQSAAAKVLGVTQATISRREAGEKPIDAEAARALRCAVEHRPGPRARPRSHLGPRR